MPLSVCRSTYSREITDKEQPLLIHRPKRRANTEVGGAQGEEGDRRETIGAGGRLRENSWKGPEGE